MLVYLFIGLFILIGSMSYEQRCRAKEVYKEFVSDLLEKEDYYLLFIQLAEQHKYIESIDNREKDIFLIRRESDSVKIYPLNNPKQRNISVRQYEDLKKRFEKCKAFYTFNIDSVSIFYNFNIPHTDYILRIDYH